MSQGAEKAKAQRDKEMARLLHQMNLSEEGARKEVSEITKQMHLTSTAYEVRNRISMIIADIDHWIALGIIDPNTDYGWIFFTCEAELREIQDQVSWYIPLVNDIIGDLAQALQMGVADKQSWKNAISWRAIEAAMENTELFVDTAQVHTGQGQDSTDEDEDEESGML